MKRIIALMMVVMFLFIPVVMAQEGEVNNFEETINPTSVNEVDMGYFMAPVNLTVTIFIPEDVTLNIDVYRQDNQVFGEYNVVGNFTTNRLIDVEGMHELRLYNTEIDSVVTVTGWWAINWNGTITNTTGTTTTGTNTTTTGTTTGRPIDIPDYLGIFLEVMVRYIIPVIVGVAIIALIFRKCRTEDFDYLVMFEDREILERQAEQEEE